MLTANTAYTFDVDVSRPDWSVGTLYEVVLLAGSTVIATSGVSDSSSLVGDVFYPLTVTFPATLSNPHFGENLRIAMVQYGDTDENEIDFDNVRLDATLVPEPSAILLSGLGAIGMLTFARRCHR